MNDGKNLRLTLPSLTEERRKEIVKVVGKIVEQYRVEMRNERRLANEQLKKSRKGQRNHGRRPRQRGTNDPQAHRTPTSRKSMSS